MRIKLYSTFKSIKLFSSILFAAFISSCTSAPSNLSDKTEVIEVFYVNWACDCPDFAEANSNTQNPDYEIRAEDCFYLEAAHPDSAVPHAFYDSLHFDYYLVLHGRFYKDMGVPESYIPETSERLEAGRVFRYDAYKLVKKK